MGVSSNENVLVIVIALEIGQLMQFLFASAWVKAGIDGADSFRFNRR